METRVSSISQLDKIELLGEDDLFIVSTPHDESRTGYRTVSLKFSDFQKELSAYIDSTFEQTIKDIAGNVYANTNIINTIRGSLQQTINTYIHDITGDVNVVISSINNVSGSLDQVINTDISKINGAVDNINNIQNWITADYAEVSTSINQAIEDVSGDIHAENGIQTSVDSIVSYINNEIDQRIANIYGSVFAENSISSIVHALSAHVVNNIDQVIDRVLGDVTTDNSIFSQVSAVSATVTNTINDLGKIKRAVSYPIVEVGITDDGDTVDVITLRDKTVNVLVLDDNRQKKLYIEPPKQLDGKYLSRDLILYLQMRKVDNNINMVLWDNACTFVCPDDESVFTEFTVGTDYIYYLSEVAVGTFYVSRQELNNVNAPVAPESDRPEWLIDDDASPE